MRRRRRRRRRRKNKKRRKRIWRRRRRTTTTTTTTNSYRMIWAFQPTTERKCFQTGTSDPLNLPDCYCNSTHKFQHSTYWEKGGGWGRGGGGEQVLCIPKGQISNKRKGVRKTLPWYTNTWWLRAWQENLGAGPWNPCGNLQKWEADAPMLRERMARNLSLRKDWGATQARDSETGLWAHRSAKDRVQMAEPAWPCSGGRGTEVTDYLIREPGVQREAQRTETSRLSAISKPASQGVPHPPGCLYTPYLGFAVATQYSQRGRKETGRR